MYFAALLGGVCALILGLYILYKLAAPPRSKPKIPISVNYHFTRRCNYSCGFCFHTATTSYVEPLPNAKRGLALLKKAGMKKLNFAGGEPFLEPVFLGELAKYCKEVLRLESVSVVTNGSKVTDRWLSKYGQYLDIIAVSCDSFNEETNISIGRGQGAHLKSVTKLSQLCRSHGIKFKVNTVVNRYNLHEDMHAPIRAIAPFRWKCFQVLIVEGENDSATTKTNAHRFTITPGEFEAFCDAHSDLECLVPEPNDVMRSSYLLLDEYMRFLNKGVGEPTRPILEIGVHDALEHVEWDQVGFKKRGGVYDWTRDAGSEREVDPSLEF
ncbi:MAG: radical s-adenosyl methionine domain-containing 2 [Lasallia pustulata]|uniref:Radical s-adenosyl methionine domain-containing 2 n=1 Tax=Lasallia pustulata TaxID=136370 RepID=A0A5M8PGN5_9LECA|nr:MAG: radical s-adenosyl methionine domain-containing 2 [Lasallia pustulata]